MSCSRVLLHSYEVEITLNYLHGMENNLKHYTLLGGIWPGLCLWLSFFDFSVYKLVCAQCLKNIFIFSLQLRALWKWNWFNSQLPLMCIHGHITKLENQSNLWEKSNFYVMISMFHLFFQCLGRVLIYRHQTI